MGLFTGTDNAQDAEAMADGGAAYEVDQGAAVVGMDPAGTFRSTAGARGKCAVFYSTFYR